MSGHFPGQGGWAGWHSRHQSHCRLVIAMRSHCWAVWTFSRLGGNFQILFLPSPSNASPHLGDENRRHPEEISVPPPVLTAQAHPQPMQTPRPFRAGRPCCRQAQHLQRLASLGKRTAQSDGSLGNGDGEVEGGEVHLPGICHQDCCVLTL